MNKRIRLVVAAAAVVGGFTVSQAGAVSAAHCVAPADEPSSPGFSYFGNDHVAEDEAHGGTPEGGNPGPHVAPDGSTSSGASACRDATGSPSDRAPGQDR